MSSLPRAFVVLMSHLFDNYLILNESTFFYFYLSATQTNEVGKIQKWTAQVEKARATKNEKSTEAAKVTVSGPCSVTSTTVVHTTTSSSAVTAAPTTRPLKKAKLGPDNSAVSAFLEEDESAERDAALTSPIKGKQRLSSKVRSSNTA